MEWGALRAEVPSPLTAHSQAPLFPSPCSGSKAGPCSPDTGGTESAPVAVREKMRSRFHGSHDLIHRLFVCISGAPSAPGGAWAPGHTGGWAGFRAVAGTLQQSPQEGWGAGPSPGAPSPRHFLAPSRILSPAKRWALCVRRPSSVGGEPRLGPRALTTHPRGPVQSDVLTDPVSFRPLGEGSMTASSPGIQRGA